MLRKTNSPHAGQILAGGSVSVTRASQSSWPECSHRHSGFLAKYLAKNLDMGGCLEYCARVHQLLRLHSFSKLTEFALVVPRSSLGANATQQKTLVPHGEFSVSVSLSRMILWQSRNTQVASLKANAHTLNTFITSRGPNRKKEKVYANDRWQ